MGDPALGFVGQPNHCSILCNSEHDGRALGFWAEEWCGGFISGIASSGVWGGTQQQSWQSCGQEASTVDELGVWMGADVKVLRLHQWGSIWEVFDEGFSTSRKLYISHNYSLIFYTLIWRAAMVPLLVLPHKSPSCGGPYPEHGKKNSASTNEHLPSWHQATPTSGPLHQWLSRRSLSSHAVPTRFCASPTGLLKCGLLPGGFSTLHSGTYSSLLLLLSRFSRVRLCATP